MDLTEKTIARKDVFKGKVITVHEDTVLLPNGETSRREEVDHHGGVCIAILDDENRLYFVRQYRYAYSSTILELPAGKLESGEDPFEAAKREQTEETGTTGKNYISLGKIYPSPGYTNEIISLWACRVSETGSMKLDEDEFVEVEKINIDTAVKMVLSNEIPDSKTQIGILKTKELLSKGLI
jgi:ADP-ribose pyrophosphatase